MDASHLSTFVKAWEAASGERMEEWGMEPNEFASSRLSDKRPSFDSLMLRLAHLISTRSIDPSTKHGAVIVDKQSRILSMGYNGAVQGLEHDKIVWTRPEKYDYMIHAEVNAILFAKTDLKGCTIYITGPSCVYCFNMIAQSGITRCVFGPRVAKCITEHSQKVQTQIAEAKGIEIVTFKTIDSSTMSLSSLPSEPSEPSVTLETTSLQEESRKEFRWQDWLDSVVMSCNDEEGRQEGSDGLYLWFVGRCGETHGIHFIVEGGRLSAVPVKDLCTFWQRLIPKISGFASYDAHGMGLFGRKATATTLLIEAYNALQETTSLPIHVAGWDRVDESTLPNKPDAKLFRDETVDGVKTFRLARLKKGSYVEEFMGLDGKPIEPCESDK